MQEPRVLIVADDLTGAMDTAGPFAQRGLATCVVAEPLVCDPAQVLGTQIVSLNTESRHLSSQQAATRVQACALRFTGTQAFNIIFKKIDSTLRGNVVAETLALKRACRRDCALVAPAFPAQGRTVRDGVVFVDGVALPQTGFARDALSPPPLAPLAQVFGSAAAPLNVFSWTPGTSLPGASGAIVIADGQTDTDLATVLALAGARLHELLLVGSAGLGMALAGTLGSDSPELPGGTPIEGPILYVIGSRAVQNREQVECLRALPDTVVLEAPNGVAPEYPDLRSAAQVVIQAVPHPASGEGEPEQVAKGLARSALQLSRRLGSRALVATGGDTAIALLRATGCAALEVLGDLMPGIPYARLTLEEKRLLLVTKAGGFGNRDTLVDIARRLRPAA